MPFGKYENFDECLADNADKDDPAAYCAALHYKITGKWPGESSKGGSMKLTDKDIESLVKTYENKRVGNVQNLIDTWDDWAGSYTACVDVLTGKPGIDDPESLCAWLHYQAEGKWPGEASIKIEGIEYRAFPMAEIRALREDNIIEGHAAVFNKLSEDLGGFREQVSPGAFKQSIVEDDIFATFNHNPDLVLGRNRAGTLKLKEDNVGLRMTITPPDTQTGRDLFVLIERGDITGASFSFVTLEDGWDKLNGGEIRTLKRAKLLDVSPVTFPAYKQTDVAVAKRSWKQWHASQKPVQRELRKRKLQLIDK